MNTTHPLFHPFSTTPNRNAHPLIHWTARLLSIPAIMLGFFIAVGPVVPWTTHFSGLEFLSSLIGLIYSIALVLAWRHELGGGVVALGSLAVWSLWNFVMAEARPFSAESLLVWPPALLFVCAALYDAKTPVAPASTPDQRSAPEAPSSKPEESSSLLAVPHTSLGWWALGLTACMLVFMRLFWLQSEIPRDRSTFFADPINAVCLIGIFACPLIGSVLAAIDMIRKRERSWTLIPVLVLGPVAVLWILGAIFGNP